MSNQKWIYIPGNVPSLKNSKQITQLPVKGARSCPVCKKRPGRPMLIPSKIHKAYSEATHFHWKQNAVKFRDMAAPHIKPLYVLMYFIRDSRRKWVFTNAVDTVQDLMVENNWIEDDNTSEMFPVPYGYRVNKEKTGVYISVLQRDTPYMEKLFSLDQS